MGNNVGVVHAAETQAPGGDCPVQSSSGSDGLDPRNMMPPANQLPAPNQPFPLPTERQKSSIPRSGTEDNWVYPSQQMFYNALLRKGWEFGPDDLEQSDMDHIIKIHNANNESAWEEVTSKSLEVPFYLLIQVLLWESLHSDECKAPKLKSFGGKAKYFSPRARLRGWLGYELPFDRHDWIVDRNGKEVRYIIDYYDGDMQPGSHRFAQLDVRPAMDSFEAVADRVKVDYSLIIYN